MKKTKQVVYANAAQIAFLESTAKRKTAIIGRGGGKGTVMGFQSGIIARSLPRAKGFIAAQTFGQVLNITLADMEQAWQFMGLFPYNKATGLGHYVKFQKPPAEWLQPYSKTNDYERVITFMNGCSIEVLSIAKGEHLRGGSFDFGFIDESGTVKRDIVFKVLRSKIRGNTFRFNSHLHHLFCDVTSSPWLALGKWVYEIEDRQRFEPDKYFFLECSGEINKAVLGQEYYDNLKAEMTQLEYEVEVLSKRVDSVPDCFYPTFNEAKHCVFDTQSYQLNDAGIYTTSDSYLDPKKKLEVSFDFNASFTSCIVCQEVADEFRVDNNLFVKEDKNKSLVRALVEKVCATYITHQHKEIDVHGDRNGNNKSAFSPLTAYEEVELVFKEHGWKTNRKVTGLDSDHHVRHLVLEELLSENKPRAPKIRVNANKCRALIVSIKNTPVLPGFKKDKRSEADKTLPQERATHLSDCFDNILFRKYSTTIGYARRNDHSPSFA